MDRRSFGVKAVVCWAWSLARPSTAAPRYPARPIRLIVTGAAGSPPDALARILSEPLGQRGQPVLVDNRPGALGTLAMGAVARAAPDGHTLGIFGLPLVVAPSLLPEISYDIARAFAPVTLLVWTANVLVVPAGAAIASVAELVALAQARPRGLTCAHGGNGTPSHLATALFAHQARIEVEHVPHKGIPAALVALRSRLVDFAFAGVAAALPLIRSGQVRALATAGAQRLPAFTVPRRRRWRGWACTPPTPRDPKRSVH
jgi:tripartite-type tricarboxylate transporter receptor subunit TctC